MLLKDREKEKNDLKKIIKYITMCTVLHNKVINFGDEYKIYKNDNFSVVSKIDADHEIMRMYINIVLHYCSPTLIAKGN